MNNDKYEENEIREKLNENVDKVLNNLLLSILGKGMLGDIDSNDMEVANSYVSKLRIMLIANNKKDE